MLVLGVMADSYESGPRSIRDIRFVVFESLRESDDCVRIAYLFDSTDNFGVNAPTMAQTGDEEWEGNWVVNACKRTGKFEPSCGR